MYDGSNFYIAFLIGVVFLLCLLATCRSFFNSTLPCLKCTAMVNAKCTNMSLKRGSTLDQMKYDHIQLDPKTIKIKRRYCLYVEYEYEGNKYEGNTIDFYLEDMIDIDNSKVTIYVNPKNPYQRCRSRINICTAESFGGAVLCGLLFMGIISVLFL